MFALLVGYRYRSAAVVTDAPGGADADIAEVVEELRGQPGTRVPHVWVQDHGHRVSTLDLLGSGFSVLTAGDPGRWQPAAAAVSGDLGLRIPVHGIRGDEWAAVTGLEPGGALLVRPDDFVGWRADELPRDAESALNQAISAILCRK